MDSLQFNEIDYFIFIFSLLIPIFVGLYFAFCGTKQASEKEYLYGNQNVNPNLVGLSLFSSAFSAVLIIGLPLEIYYYGTQYIFHFFGVIIGIYLSWIIVIPVFCGNLDIKTPYEYYKLRYNEHVKLLASFIYIIYSLLVMPVVLYAPSLTISQTTGFSIFICATIISAVCIFYTTFGGFSAVIWIDAFQALIMIASYLFVSIAGMYRAGGWNEVISKGYEGGRIEFFNMNPNPLERTTFWSTVIGFIFLHNSHSGCTAGALQRYMSLKNEKQAKISTVTGFLGIMTTSLIGSFIGLIMYAQYRNCDPILNKDIQSPNQMLIFFITDTINYIPGFHGIFIAGIFCAALSTLSSVLNTISGIIYYEIVLKFCKTNFSKNNGTLIMKLIVIVNGILYLSSVPILENSKHILELALSIAGITYGAILGMVLLGVLVPQSNAKGVIAGALTSIAVMIWINIGAQYYQVNSYYKKELSIANCTISTNNTTASNLTNIIIDKSGLDNIFFLYKLSYLYYSLFGTLVTMLVAIIVSYITRSDKVENINPLLVAPFLRSYVQNKINSE